MAWWLTVEHWMNELVIVVVIVLIGTILSKLVSKLLQNILHHIDLDRFAKKAGVNLPLEHGIAKIVEYVLLVIAVVMALQHIGLANIVLYIVATAALALLIATFVLSIKEFVPNFFAGLHIYRKKIVRKGDSVQIGTIKGKVTEVSLIETKISTKKGDLLHVPNVMLLKEIVIKKKV